VSIDVQCLTELGTSHGSTSPGHHRGTTSTAILKVLSEGPLYAYRIIQVLESRSQGLFAFTEGLIYPSLHRLEREGLLTSEWREKDGRPRKYYALTEAGRRRLAQEEREIRAFARGIVELLDHKGEAPLHGG
jgi:PadR family transcriptional regulator, regulatory protein PadR